MLKQASLVMKSSQKPTLDDQVYTKLDGDRGIFLLADGATGLGYDRFASAIFIEHMRQIDLEIVDRTDALRSEFLKVDQRIQQLRYPCDTTGIVAIVKDDLVHGMSIGDSCAFLIPRNPEEPASCLSYTQSTKPRIGGGREPDMLWTAMGLNDDLCLIGSDGVFEFIDFAEIRAICSGKDRQLIPQKLHESIINKCGQLHDDFAAIVFWND
jgi:serine/threonine protein phosphatase PrpC